MLESMVEWMSYPMYYAFDGAGAAAARRRAHATIYPYGPFPPADGRTVMLGPAERARVAASCKLVA
jgi:crotonobetainyl-CoA:carnitine CoA-transferase CaiB-like acyl-CoA transferase